MKNALTLTTLLLIAFALTSGAATPAQLSNSSKTEVTPSIEQKEVMVYYFHSTRRCPTCEAVEAVTKSYIETDFSSKAAFTAINRETDRSNPLVKKYNIKGSALIIAKGNKSVNIINEAFLNARNNPDKLREKIRSVIETL